MVISDDIAHYFDYESSIRPTKKDVEELKLLLQEEKEIVEHQKWILKSLQKMWIEDIDAAKGFLDDVIRIMDEE
jgi:hypothetical protein